eukprot:gb/GECG01003846.1/.p1 GENE.gb/GECG01003846.1/~~gb/GECG01003846.1/.p1  ORF type:complete len:464 (+),score=59.43 gb/GECG01003846.1/:1-1392(+)
MNASYMPWRLPSVAPYAKPPEKKRSLRPSIRFQSFVHAYRCLQPQKVRNNLQTQFSQLIGSTQVFGAMMGKSKSSLDNIDEATSSAAPVDRTHRTSAASAAPTAIPSARAVTQETSSDIPAESAVVTSTSETTNSASCATSVGVSPATAAHESVVPNQASSRTDTRTPQNQKTNKRTKSSSNSSGKKRSRRPLGERSANRVVEPKQQNSSRKKRRDIPSCRRNEGTLAGKLFSAHTTEEDITRILLEEPVVFCCDGLAMEERNHLQNLADKIGATIQDSWSEDVTHCILSTVAVNTDRDHATVEDVQRVAHSTAAVRSGRGSQRLQEEQVRTEKKRNRFFLARKRTSKYLMSILSGAWVLGPDWISASSMDTAPTLIGEDPYQVIGDVETAASSLCKTMINNGPRLARSLAVREKESPATGILDGRGVVLIGEWQFPAPIEKDIIEMLNYLGAGVRNQNRSTA